METTADEKLYPAKYAVIVVLVLAVSGSLGGWLYSARLQRRPIQFWSAETAVLILRGPQVELLELSETDRAGDAVLSMDQRHWKIAHTHNVTKQPGLKNIRSALVNDYSFDWNQTLDTRQARWEFGFRFRDGERSAIVFFAPAWSAAHAPSTGQTTSIAAGIRGISEFVRDAKPRATQ